MSKPMNNYERERLKLIVPYAEPNSAATGGTTFDQHNEHLTVKSAPNRVGDRQVMAGQVYEYDGDKWVVCS